MSMPIRRPGQPAPAPAARASEPREAAWPPAAPPTPAAAPPADALRRDTEVRHWRASQLSLGLIVCSLLALLAVPTWTARRTAAIRTGVLDVVASARDLTDDIGRDMAVEAEAQRLYSFGAKPELLDRFDAARADDERALARLRPLATVSDKPLEIEGYGVIPPLSQTLPGFTAPANYFGIFIPKGVPDEVVKTVEKIWAENIAKSEALKKYAVSRGALFAPQYGEAAQKAVFPAIQANAWLLFDGGKAKVSPDTVGIPKP